jgi:hypothetical protein
MTNDTSGLSTAITKFRDTDTVPVGKAGRKISLEILGADKFLNLFITQFLLSSS